MAAFRVLKPGGRLAVSDVVVRGDAVPEAVRRSMELWVGCVAGALEERSYREKLTRAGFESVDLEPTRIYRAEDARHFLEDAGLSDEAVLAQIDGRFMSAFVRAQAGGGGKDLLLLHLLRVTGMGDRGRDRGSLIPYNPVLRFEAHGNGGSTEQDLRYAKGRLG